MALTLKINLASVLQNSFTREQRVALSSEIHRPAVKREFGFRVIDAILKRTNAGIDVNGAPFEKYSRAYKKSSAFEIYGKSNTPNLKLTGSMQAAITVIPSDGTTIKITIPDGEDSLKARRHNFGLKKMPRREFFGISTEEQGKILKKLLRDVNTGERLEQIEQELQAEPNSLNIVTQILRAEAIEQQQTDISFLSALGAILNGDI